MTMTIYFLVKRTWKTKASNPVLIVLHKIHFHMETTRRPQRLSEA